MDKFKSESIIDFFDTYQTDKDCMLYLSKIKWKEGFKCSKCGHTKSTIRKSNYARDCNRCHHVESPTANTLFHRVRFGLCKAFTIVFEMSATTKSISASQISRRLKISRTTAWYFMQKVRLAMKSSELPILIKLIASISCSSLITEGYLGIPVKLGAGGIKEIIELQLIEEEMALLKESSKSVQKVMKVLDDMHLF